MSDKLWLDEAQRLPDDIPLRNQANADMRVALGYPTADTVAKAEAYHAILTDLIAELRGHEYVSGDYLTDLADEYAARLREVTGGE